eukprot:3828523-Pleurochrysis_carterae.AAC.1
MIEHINASTKLDAEESAHSAARRDPPTLARLLRGVRRCALHLAPLQRLLKGAQLLLPLRLLAILRCELVLRNRQKCIDARRARLEPDRAAACERAHVGASGARAWCASHADARRVRHFRSCTYWCYRQRDYAAS